jgi:hypothetical protein
MATHRLVFESLSFLIKEFEVACLAPMNRQIDLQRDGRIAGSVLECVSMVEGCEAVFTTDRAHTTAGWNLAFQAYAISWIHV